MKFDDIISELGEFGPYQKKMYCLVCLVGIPAAFQTMVAVFILAVPEHRCAIPSLDNDTYEYQGQWHHDVINRSIPQASGHEWAQCSMYRSDLSNQTVSCDRWVYDRSVFQSTVITQLQLVCDAMSLRTYANMILMGGLLGGSLILGSLSDLIGRKKVLLIGIAGQFSFGLATAFVTTYVQFVIMRFFATFFGIGMFLSAFVIGMELVGPSKRKLAGIVIEIFWTIGLFIMTGLAYVLRDWKHLQIAVSTPIVLLLVYIFILPESPRWLISKGTFEEAAQILKKAALENHVTLSEKALDLKNLEVEGKGEKIWHIFTTPRLLVRCLIIFFNWFVASMVYYGLSLNAGSLSGDIYLNSFLLALVELASYIFCLLLLDFAGRKFLQCFSMLLSGIACICILFPVIYSPDLGAVTLALSLIGKFGASAGFAIIYIFSAELFPTVMRNSGLGFSSFISRIGGILAPYIADIGPLIDGNFSVALPLLIFGALSIAAGLLALLLPETAHNKLPETVEDAKNFGRTGPSKRSYDLALDSKVDKDGVKNPVFVLEEHKI